MASKTFEAPIPGTFFRKPAPDRPPFKGEGDNVAIGDTVGLIEVMKTFMPVVAEATGRLLAKEGARYRGLKRLARHGDLPQPKVSASWGGAR